MNALGGLISVVIFVALGVGFVFFNLRLGKLSRPKIKTAEKSDVYECGETPMGPGWVQFDLRFYIVALVFLVFDVEVALLYPWAVVFMTARGLALAEMLAFFALVALGFAYLWRFGYLEWVRSIAGVEARPESSASLRLSADARRDPDLASEKIEPLVTADLV
jgi:NADH-quinone oxidoreductase subunit A